MKRGREEALHITSPGEPHRAPRSRGGARGRWPSLLRGLRADSGTRLPGFKSQPHHLLAGGHKLFVLR